MNDLANQNQHQNQQQQGPSMKDVVRSATAAGAESRLDRWRSEGARILGELHRRLSEARQAYTIGKAAIIAEAELKRDELEHTYSERLREFDRGHEDKVAQLKAELDEILDYREIGRWSS